MCDQDLCYSQLLSQEIEIRRETVTFFKSLMTKKLLKAIKSIICGVIFPLFPIGASPKIVCVYVHTHMCAYLCIYTYMYVHVYIIQLGILSFKCVALS